MRVHGNTNCLRYQLLLTEPEKSCTEPDIVSNCTECIVISDFSFILIITVVMFYGGE